MRRGSVVVAGVLGVLVLAGCRVDGVAGAGVSGEAKAPGSVATPAPARSSPARTSPAPTRPAPASPAPARTSPAPRTSAPRPSAPPRSTAPALPRKGQRTSDVRALQARLWSLGFFRQQPTGFFGDVTAQALAAFQRDRGLAASGVLDAATWARLRAAGPAPTKAALYPETTLPPTRPDPRCLTGRALCVSKKSRTLAWMVDGRVVSVMDVRFGSAYTPTRDGTFKVYWKSRDHVSTIYHTPMPYALFFSGGQAVHYSPDFAARGYAGASHGCVNVRDKAKVAALFDTVRTGDKVIVY